MPAADAPRALRRWRRLVALALLAGALASAGAVPAAAQDRAVSAAAAAELAREAATDDDALAELRAVTEVEGRPVDLVAATADLGSARAARLDALARALDGGARGGAAAEVPDAGRDADRRAAQEVLDDDKFRERRVPKPFQGVLSWLADRLRPVGRLFEPILDLPGGPYVLGGLLATLGAAAIAFVSSRRSGAAVAASVAGRLVDPDLDPVDLDRRADEAEGEGDALGAVRLRYQAGLLRLAREGRLDLRADTTAAGAAHQVDHPVLHQLTADFEEVVYGDRPATAAVLARSRQGWAEVLGARSRR